MTGEVDYSDEVMRVSEGGRFASCPRLSPDGPRRRFWHEGASLA